MSKLHYEPSAWIAEVIILGDVHPVLVLRRLSCLFSVWKTPKWINTYVHTFHLFASQEGIQGDPQFDPVPHPTIKSML